MKRRSGGFTLIEVVISLTVFSFIMVAVVAGLRTIARSQESLDTLTERTEEIRLVSGFVRSVLDACARTQGNSGGGIVVGGGSSKPDFGSRYLRGGPDWIDMNTTMLVGAGFGGNYLIRLQADGEQLTIRWQAPIQDYQDPLWEELEPYEVVDGLEEIQFRYLGVGAPDWQEEWTDSKNLPATIGLSLKVKGRYWPEIVVSLI